MNHDRLQLMDVGVMFLVVAPAALIMTFVTWNAWIYAYIAAYGGGIAIYALNRGKLCANN